MGYARPPERLALVQPGPHLSHSSDVPWLAHISSPCADVRYGIWDTLPTRLRFPLGGCPPNRTDGEWFPHLAVRHLHRYSGSTQEHSRFRFSPCPSMTGHLPRPCSGRGALCHPRDYSALARLGCSLHPLPYKESSTTGRSHCCDHYHYDRPHWEPALVLFFHHGGRRGRRGDRRRRGRDGNRRRHRGRGGRRRCGHRCSRRCRRYRCRRGRVPVSVSAVPVSAWLVSESAQPVSATGGTGVRRGCYRRWRGVVPVSGVVVPVSAPAWVQVSEPGSALASARV